MLKSLLVLSMLALGANVVHTPGKYYNDYNSVDKCLVAAAELNKEIAEEGTVLLKNDGTLPLAGNERVSVFGVRNDSLVGGSSTGGAFDMGASVTTESVADSLTKAGFKVNPTLKSVYDADSSAIGKEITEFNGKVMNSLDIYNDAAFIVLSRAGGEGSDQSTVTSETVDRETDTHKALQEKTVVENGETVTKRYKHSLMLTDSEEALVKLVKAHYKKIVVVLNTSNPMEVAGLQNDDAINAIVDVSRPGKNGIFALGEIINGTVNPSGRLQDEWDVDHTADPVWYNFGDNSQVNASSTMLDPEKRTVQSGGGSGGFPGGFPGGMMTASESDDDPDNYPYNTKMDGAKSYNGSDLSYTMYSIDYEEGIYTGYKYYETRYVDMYDQNASQGEEWYKNNVVYPYGFGLSYTSFSMNIVSVETSQGNKVNNGDTIDASDLANFAGKKANIDKMTVKVEVKNTGTVAGKQSVQLYAHSPYTGKIEKAEHTIVGFAKTGMLQPGESEIVTIEFNTQDMASWDTDYSFVGEDGSNLHGGYTLEKGDYILRVMDSSHFDRSTDLSSTVDAYDQLSFKLTEDAHMTADDYSLKEVSDKFTYQEEFDANATEHKYYFNSKRTKEIMADGASEQTVMSRKDFEGTFPKAPTAADRTFKKEWYSNTTYWLGWANDSGCKDKESDPWYITNENIPLDWTQSTDSTTKADIQFSDMVGIDYESDEVIASGKFQGKTGKQAWTEFMNQLTWNQIASIVEYGGYGTTALDNVGKAEDFEADGPTNLSNTFQWGDSPLLAGTFNVELIYKQGQIMGDMCMFEGDTGWYGPAFNYHRSPFSGRNFEYYSQDAFVCGTIGSYAIQGAQSRGVVAYSKHIAFNDQETHRGETYEWIDEQTMRENDLKSFQIAFQEGNSKAGMVGYGHVSGIPNTNNYNLLTGIYKEEWGWRGALDTDGYIGWIDITSPDMMNRAGCELELRTPPWYETPSGVWNTSYRNGKGGVDVKTGENGALEESPNQYYYTRMAAMRVLWNRTDTTGMQNGYTTLVYEGTTLSANQYEKASGLSVAVDDKKLTDGSFATYSITRGKLPAGLTLNSNTGEITGTASEDGEFNFTVQALVDGYVKKTADFKINVNSAFSLDADGDDVNSMKVGQEFMTKINSSTFTTAGGKYDTVTYSLESGDLPNGITIADDGTISGTPTESGTFNFVVKVTAVKKGSGGFGPFGGGRDTTTIASYPVSMTIAEGEKPLATTYTVNFNTNGGTAVSSQIVEKDGTIAAFNNPTKTGYVFTGWYTDANLTNAADLSSKVTGNVTYYAGWEEIKKADDTPKTDTDTKVETKSNDALAISGLAIGSVGLVAACVSVGLFFFLKKH